MFFSKKTWNIFFSFSCWLAFIFEPTTFILLVRADDDDDLDDLDKEDSQENDPVVVLTDANFRDFIKAHTRVLVEYYAPWCGHCKSLEPEYRSAAETLKKNKRKTVLAKVDATVENAIAQEAGVQGYPTLYYYVDGEKSQYTGGRQAADIVSWIEAREKDPVEICEKEAVDKMIKDAEKKFVIVAKVLKKSGKATALKKAMGVLQAAEKTSDIYACYEYLAKGSDEKKLASMTMTRTKAFEEEDKIVNYKGVWNAAKVETWIIASTYDQVGIYDHNWYLDLSKAGADYVVIAAAPSTKILKEDKKKEYVSEMKKLMKKPEYAKKYRFAIAEGEKNRDDITGIIGEDAIVILEATGGAAGPTRKKFVITPGVPESIGAFIDEFEKGKLKPTYKSQSVTPEESIDNGVTVLTGDTFEKIAYDSKKDVFVEFYAPWCGHCKKLAPEWEALAKKIKDLKLDEKVVIAKMDATENECEIEITGFPKIVLFPAVKNSYKMKKEFSAGERTLQPLLNFLGENGANLDGVDLDSPAGEKMDKGSFSMVDRELKKKQKEKTKKTKEEL